MSTRGVSIRFSTRGKGLWIFSRSNGNSSVASTNKHMESAKKKRSTVFLFVGFVISGFLLFFYSYTQVDLSLTLSSAGILQSIQKAFQSIGYFQRPLATTIFVGITTLMFGLYGLLLRQIQKGLWI